MYLRNGVPGPCGTAPYQIREGTRSRPQTDDARRLTIPGMKSRSVPVVFIAVPFVGLPCRMLNIELVTPQEVTTMAGSVCTTPVHLGKFHDVHRYYLHGSTLSLFCHGFSVQEPNTHPIAMAPQDAPAPGLCIGVNSNDPLPRPQKR